MPEAVTVPCLMMISIISEESLARADRPTHTHTHSLAYVKKKINLDFQNKKEVSCCPWKYYGVTRTE